MANAQKSKIRSHYTCYQKRLKHHYESKPKLLLYCVYTVPCPFSQELKKAPCWDLFNSTIALAERT